MIFDVLSVAWDLYCRKLVDENMVVKSGCCGTSTHLAFTPRKVRISNEPEEDGFTICICHHWKTRWLRRFAIHETWLWCSKRGNIVERFSWDFWQMDQLREIFWLKLFHLHLRQDFVDFNGIQIVCKAFCSDLMMFRPGTTTNPFNFSNLNRISPLSSARLFCLSFGGYAVASLSLPHWIESPR